MKTKNKISGYLIRGAVVAVMFSCTFVGLTAALNVPSRSGDVGLVKPTNQSKALTFEDRVAYQRAIEEVYWHHRIWPKENSGAKPSLDNVMSQAQIEAKVRDYLRNSRALELYSQRPITPEELQAEMDRIARNTRQPDMLREIFAALGNDAAVIAECVARPVLAERLVRELSARDEQFRTQVAALPGYTAMLQVNSSDTDPRSPADDVPKTPRLRTMAASEPAKYQLPAIISTPNTCIDNWTATSLPTGVVVQRAGHTAVWTGSEMIVWGSGDFQNSGGRYNPTTDSWVATSTANAPDGRYFHTAVWTGTEMIVWGGLPCSGCGYLNTGGRYNPSTDTWTATSTNNTPSARIEHTAVWTGTEMIVWGGASELAYENTGGRYNPATDSWAATSLPFVRCGPNTCLLDGRAAHTAVWTGTEMIVWGGSGGTLGVLNDGGRYSPSSDAWTATNFNNAPDPRTGHTAVWTGSEMIIWGGDVCLPSCSNSNSGGKYNPVTNRWSATSLVSPPVGRFVHTAVWTGNEMIVWGGQGDSGLLNTGGRYNPVTNSWTATNTANAPDPRTDHTAVWTGSEMIVWGGYDGVGATDTGGRYCGQRSPTPTPTPTPTPPIRVTLKTNPAGLTFTVDGTTYTSTQRFSWLPGSSHTIATTSPQSGDTGVQYLWAKWSDHGAISHTVAPTTNTTYTATFKTQYFLTMAAGTGGRVTPASGWKNSGATVSISARPARGYSLSNWSGSGTGSYSGTNNPASITMGGPITETATFIHN